MDQIAVVRNAVERDVHGKYIISHLAAPSPDELAAYHKRYTDIEIGLKPGDMEPIRRRMARLFLLFPAAGQAPGSVEAMVDAYSSVLAGFPLWAIDNACKKVINSGATFRPSAPELRKLCDNELKDVYKEADSLYAILTAETYHENPATERDRVKREFNSLLGTLRGTNIVDGKTVEECERDIRIGFPHLQEPVVLSDEILRQFDL